MPSNPREPGTGNPHRPGSRLRKARLSVEVALLADQKADQRTARKIQPTADPRAAKADARNLPWLHGTRTEQQGGDHLGTYRPRGPPQPGSLQIIGRWITSPQVHPRATPEGIPETIAPDRSHRHRSRGLSCGHLAAGDQPSPRRPSRHLRPALPGKPLSGK